MPVRAVSPHLIQVLLCGVILAGCQCGSQLQELSPRLEVVAVTPPTSGPVIEANAHYLIDFGSVPIGTTATVPVSVKDTGTFKMTVQPLDVSAPFGASLTATLSVSPGAEQQFAFTFSPTMSGQMASVTVTLQSDGGAATFDLQGTGVPECQYSVMPPALTFAALSPGLSEVATVTVQNTGVVDCSLSAAQITQGSDPSFSVTAGQTFPADVPVGGSTIVSVTFAPTTAAAAIQGNLLLTLATPGPSGIAPPTTTVPLTASSGSAPCQFEVDPTSVTFPTIPPGQSEMSGVRVKNTGSSDCTLAGARLGSGSDPSFAIEGGLSFPVDVPMGSSVPVGVTFTPTMAGASFQGTLLLTIGAASQAVTATVPLSASATALTCSYRVNPRDLAFGFLPPGQNKTMTFTISNTGENTCFLSDMQLGPNTDPAFSLTSGQTFPGSITSGGSVNVEVTFAPTQPEDSETGTVTFDVAPPTGMNTVTLSGSSPTATAPIYTNTSTTLYKFEPTTGATMFIANFQAEGDSINDIAINGAGVMLGVSFTTMYEINPNTGECTSVANLGALNANALCYAQNGQVVVAGGNDVDLYDPTTFNRVDTLVHGSAFSSSGDIVALPDGFLYWSVSPAGGLGNDRLVKVDPSTGNTTLLGSLPTQDVWGLAWADDQLYGFSDLGNYLTIDPSNASGTVFNSSEDWYGATSNPASTSNPDAG